MATLPTHLFPETLADDFDDNHVSNEQLAWWQQRETRAVGRVDPLDVELGQEDGTRNFAVRYFAELLRVEQLHGQACPHVYFNALQLFDLVANNRTRNPLQKWLETLTVACACWLLCAKPASVDPDLSDPCAKPVAIAKHISASMGGQEITEEEVAAEEVKIFLKHSSHVTLPCILTWLATFSTRFSIATNGLCHPALHAASSWTLAIVNVYTSRTPTSSAASPQVSAIGLFTLVLLQTQLIDAESIRPPWVDAHRWQHAINIMFSPFPPRPTLEFDEPTLLAALEVATTKPLDLIRHYLFHAATALKPDHIEHWL